MLVLLNILSAAFLSFAGGDWVGNGGNLIECADGRLQLLDYYEGNQGRGISVDLGDGDSFQDHIEVVLTRLEKLSPSRALKYKMWYGNFLIDADFFSDGKFVQIPDTGPIVVPNSCDIRQIAAQRPDSEIMPGDRRYLIDLRLWERISEKDKAGLILHELIYREAIEEKQVTSTRVRYMTQILSSSAVESYNQLQMLELIRMVGLRYTDYGGYEIDLSGTEYYPNGAVQIAWATTQRAWIEFDQDGNFLRVMSK